MRHYRIGAFRAGDVVTVRLRGGAGERTPAMLCEYDEGSETYTIALPDGRRVFKVSDDEIEPRVARRAAV